MSNEELLKDPDCANRIAAHQLMTQWVKDNANEVASVIGELVPFICGECDYAGLQKALNTVNITFATVALEVVKQRNDSEEEGYKRTPLCLPADAMEMQCSLYDLSRFLKKFGPLASLMKRNEEMPSFRMSITAYDQVDSI
jgi:hypothetical protein